MEFLTGIVSSQKIRQKSRQAEAEANHGSYVPEEFEIWKYQKHKFMLKLCFFPRYLRFSPVFWSVKTVNNKGCGRLYFIDGLNTSK